MVMNQEQLQNLIIWKLKTYRLFDDTWLEKKRIKVMTYAGKHILIEYAADFMLQEWLAHLMQCNYFVSWEPKWWTHNVWKDEYNYSVRECELKWSMHISHDGGVKAAYHLDHYNPNLSGPLHLLYDVILNWS
jgi:hypothetical protein